MKVLPVLTDRRLLGLLLGPCLFILVLICPPPETMSVSAWRVVAVAVLMATWWIIEAIPIAATALLPVALFPLLQVMSTATTTSAYANHLVFLFLGGFLIAMAMQKWNLHRRIALHIIRAVGLKPTRIILGFMLATAFLSMWISNTATTMMMLPIALAVAGQISDNKTANDSSTKSAFALALMLGIAYSASIGGVATLIGTPPNAILAGIVERLYHHRISFAAWMGFGLPLSMLMLAIAWFYLTRIAYPVKQHNFGHVTEVIHQEIRHLGPISRQEKLVAVIFALVALTWISRGLFEFKLLKEVSDASIAIAGALLLFIIPSNINPSTTKSSTSKKAEFLLDWSTAAKLPWDILILFGGGFALAQGFSDSGLTEWIVSQMAVLKGAHLVVLVLVITFVVIFLTEITSNTATATLILPVLGALAVAVGVEPMSLMVPAAVATSYAFMLPVATPPNAIVFSSRYVTIPQMARAGFYMNLVATLVITLFVIFVLPLIGKMGP